MTFCNVSIGWQYFFAIFGILILVTLVMLLTFHELDNWPGKNSKNF